MIPRAPWYPNPKEEDPYQSIHSKDPLAKDIDRPPLPLLLKLHANPYPQKKAQLEYLPLVLGLQEHQMC